MVKDHQERLQQFEDFIAGFALWINTLLEREKKGFCFSCISIHAERRGPRAYQEFKDEQGMKDNSQTTGVIYGGSHTTQAHNG